MSNKSAMGEGDSALKGPRQEHGEKKAVVQHDSAHSMLAERHKGIGNFFGRVMER